MKNIIVKTYTALALFGILIFLNSCQDVIKVDLNSAAPQTVIEASISNMPDTVKVLLTQTTDYFSPQNIAPITGAQVSLSDSSGNVFQPVVAANGVYIFGKLAGIPGTTYTLKVQENNKTYTGSSTMPKVVPIDSLALEKPADGGKDYVLNCYIHDPAGVKNYYRIKVFRNRKILYQDSTLMLESIILSSDKYYDGRYTPISIPPRRFGLNHYSPTDTLKIQLISIDSPTYYYLRELRDITRTGRFVSSTSTPDNPDNNLSNNALGYFAAWSISEKQIVVK
jgi:hypothetical protein